MAVEAEHAEAVVDDDGVTREIEVAREDHVPRVGGPDRVALRGGDIEAGVG